MAYKKWLELFLSSFESWAVEWLSSVHIWLRLGLWVVSSQAVAALSQCLHNSSLSACLPQFYPSLLQLYWYQVTLDAYGHSGSAYIQASPFYPSWICCDAWHPLSWGHWHTQLGCAHHMPRHHICHCNSGVLWRKPQAYALESGQVEFLLSGWHPWPVALLWGDQVCSWGIHRCRQVHGQEPSSHLRLCVPHQQWHHLLVIKVTGDCLTSHNREQVCHGHTWHKGGPLAQEPPLRTFWHLLQPYYTLFQQSSHDCAHTWPSVLCVHKAYWCVLSLDPLGGEGGCFVPYVLPHWWHGCWCPHQGALLLCTVNSN